MAKSNDAILVLNAGSSSIKLAVFGERGGELALELRGQVEGLYTMPRFAAHDATGRVVAEKSWGRTDLGHDGAVEYLTDFLQHHLTNHRLIGVGHRVVHGGLEFTAPVRVEPKTLEALERLIPLAPLHQPHNVSPIARLLKRAPELPQVACFDTAFHRTNPDVAQRFALPAELHEAGVQRYGFHGLSYEYIAAELPRVDARAAAGKTIVLHLGNGSSMCAMEAGRSVATTMGFTAIDGLAMGTRCGALDPGVHLRDRPRIRDEVVRRSPTEGDLSRSDVVGRGVSAFAEEAGPHDRLELLHLGGGPHHEDEVQLPSERDHVEVEQPFPGDRLAVQEGSVGALQVLEPVALAVEADPGVHAGHALHGHRHRVRLVAANHRVLPELEREDHPGADVAEELAVHPGLRHGMARG